MIAGIPKTKFWQNYPHLEPAAILDKVGKLARAVGSNFRLSRFFPEMYRKTTPPDSRHT